MHRTCLSGCQPCGQRVDGAAHLVELADALRVEPGDFEAAAAAFGDEPLPVQQMQRVGHRLARYAELFRQLVLPDAMPGGSERSVIASRIRA